MGGNSSKPKYETTSAIISKADEAKTKVPIWDGKQGPEGICVLLTLLPEDSALTRLVLAYWAFDFEFRKDTSFELVRRWSLFCPDPYPAKVADCIAWGDPEEMEKIIKSFPHVLGVVTETKDHRHSYRGTPLQITLQLKDSLIRNAQGETMAGVIQRHLIEHFGVDEVKKQIRQIRPSLESKENESKMQLKDDRQAFLTASAAIDGSLATNKEEFLADAKVIDAVNKLDEQLRKYGAGQILIEAEQEFDAKFAVRGGRGSFKNIFYEDRILGLIQLCRLNVWELQVAFYGFYHYKEGSVVPRIDIRASAGLNVDSAYMLGRDFSIDFYALNPLLAPRARRSGCRRDLSDHLSKLFSSSNTSIAEFMQRSDNPPRRQTLRALSHAEGCRQI